MPEGPPAAPFRAERTLRQKTLSSRLKTGQSPGNGGIGTRGLAGLFCNSLSVAVFPGASSAPSNAWRPDDNSPSCTNRCALAARFSIVVGHPLLRWRLLTTAASPEHFMEATIKSCHCPAANLSNLATNFSFPMRPPRGGRCNIILGKSMNNFQPRSCWSSFLLEDPATISSNAILRQIRKDPHKNRGTDFMRQPRCLNNSNKSHASNCAKPARIAAADGHTGASSSTTNNSSCIPSSSGTSEQGLPSSLRPSASLDAGSATGASKRPLTSCTDALRGALTLGSMFRGLGTSVVRHHLVPQRPPLCLST